MSFLVDLMPLTARTPDAWVAGVLADFPSFMADHAACERKASASALSFVTKYMDRAAVVEPMICLAKEELQHFHEVYRIMHRKGYSLLPDEKDPYVQALLAKVRFSREEHFLDRLLVFGMIEARGCERFGLVSEAMQDSELKDFYARLAREEAGHYRIFFRLASIYFDEEVVNQRLRDWQSWEADAMLQLEFRPAVH